MNETVRETGNEAMKLSQSVNHLSKPSVPFYNGVYNLYKLLFRLVKCTILALPWSFNDVRMQSWMKFLVV